MAAKQEQVDGLTTPRSKACLFLQASNSRSRSTVYIANWRFWELGIRQMDRLDQLAMKLTLSKRRFPSLRLLILNEANKPYLTPNSLQLPYGNSHPSSSADTRSLPPNHPIYLPTHQPIPINKTNHTILYPSKSALRLLWLLPLLPRSTRALPDVQISLFITRSI